MNITSENTFNSLIFFGAMVGLYVLVFGHRKHLVRKSGEKSPFVEDILRLPGHSASLKRLEIFDELTERYNQFLLFSILLVFSSLYVQSLFGILSMLVAIVCVCITLVRAWNLYSEIQDANLKCDGEEYVGQELQCLGGMGVMVYHDIPYPGSNIDHIVVGNDKIFAIETFVVNKNHPSSTTPTHVVSSVDFDGKTLKFPFLETAEPVEAAISHADHLRQRIEGNCGVKFQVMPVVAIPGWHVSISRKGKAEVLVINPKRGNGLKAWLGVRNDSRNRKKVNDYLSSVARSIPPTSKRTDAHADQAFEFWFSPRFKGKVLKD